MKKTFIQKLKNIAHAQENADAVDELEKQLHSMRNQIEGLKAKNKLIAHEKEILQQKCDDYVTTIRDFRREKLGRKSL